MMILFQFTSRLSALSLSQPFWKPFLLLASKTSWSNKFNKPVAHYCEKLFPSVFCFIIPLGTPYCFCFEKEYLIFLYLPSPCYSGFYSLPSHNPSLSYLSAFPNLQKLLCLNLVSAGTISVSALLFTVASFAVYRKWQPQKLVSYYLHFIALYYTTLYYSYLKGGILMNYTKAEKHSVHSLPLSQSSLITYLPFRLLLSIELVFSYTTTQQAQGDWYLSNPQFKYPFDFRVSQPKNECAMEWTYSWRQGPKYGLCIS